MVSGVRGVFLSVIVGVIGGLGLMAEPAGADTSLDLLNAANIQIDGADPNDSSGREISGAGDVNGDGRDDIIIGVAAADNNSRTGSGSSYVIYGQAANTAIDLSSLNPGQGFRIDGAATGDASGDSVSGAGDVNGDGWSDIIIGAPVANNNSRTDSGSSYVIYGQNANTDIDLAALTSSRGFRIDGATFSDNVGATVSGAGDVNGDGRDDLIMGAPGVNNNSRSFSGSSYVIYGQATNSNIDLATLTSSQGFLIDGAAANDFSGDPVSGAGDVNADGRDDVIIGAVGADNNGRNLSGSSYVIYGQATNANVDLAALTSSQGFRVDGAAASDFSGDSASGAGDVNGDGRDDMVIGSPNADNNSRGLSGSSYVIYGQVANTNVDLATLTSSQGFRVDGAATNDNSGKSVSGAGDVNGDGRGDIIIGADGADNNVRGLSGSSYVIYGKAANTNIDLAALASSQGFRVDGAATNDTSGRAVSGAGDVNGDGRDDIIIGADGADNNSRNLSGSSYVVYSTFLPRVSYPPVVLGLQGEPLSVSPSSILATGARTLSITPPLPAGLTLNPTNGMITGTPTTTGITSHEITLEDQVGITSATVKIGVVNATGPTGPTGATGATGATGSQGPIGPTGPAGSTNQNGHPAKNSKVSCKVNGKGSKRKITCKVTLTKPKATTLNWQFKLGKKTVSKGKKKTSKSGKATISIPKAGKLKKGSYTLTITGRSGKVKIRVR